VAISTVGNAPLDFAGLCAHAKKHLCVFRPSIELE